jgi:hypothetical protein
MIEPDRDPARERQQIHAISMNVRRRLARLTEQARQATPRVADEIENGVAAISDIEYEISRVTSALAHGEMLDRGSLRHILGCQQRALEMVELLEAMAAAARYGTSPPPYGRALAPDRPRALPSPSMFTGEAPRGRPQAMGHVLAAATVNGGALRYAPAVEARHAPRALLPAPAPRPAAAAPLAQPAGIPPVLTRIADSLARETAPPRASRQPQAPPRGAMQQLVAKPGSAALATVAATFAASIVLWSFAFSSGGEGPQARASIAAEADQSGKLAGRLADASPLETGSVSQDPAPGSAAGIVVSPPEGVATRRMQVVLSTRSTMEEAKQDFLSFREAYPQILGMRRAKIERMGDNDGQLRHRLVLVPPLPEADARAVCEGLNELGFNGCWTRPVTVSTAAQ